MDGAQHLDFSEPRPMSPVLTALTLLSLRDFVALRRIGTFSEAKMG